MPCFTVPIHEANDCHLPAGSPQGGQFCSKGLSSLGDEDGTGAGPAPHQPFLVLRVGRAQRTELVDVNGGNADAIVDLYMRWLNDELPSSIGDTLHVFEVTVPRSLRGYHRFNQGVASAMPGAESPSAGTVGRYVYPGTTEIAYSFPKGGAYTAKHLLSTPLDVQQYGGRQEQVRVLRAHLAQLLRGKR